MNISYAFTSGRLETLFKISNHLEFGEKNNVINEQLILDKFREDILLKKSSIEDTQLYKILILSESKIIQNRLARSLKENTDFNKIKRGVEDYKKGVWHELQEYKLSVRLVNAKNILDKKYNNKTGMDITSRDISEMIGISSSTLRNMLAHKRDVVVGMLEKFEKFTDSY